MYFIIIIEKKEKKKKEPDTFAFDIKKVEQIGNAIDLLDVKTSKELFLQEIYTYEYL